MNSRTITAVALIIIVALLTYIYFLTGRSSPSTDTVATSTGEVSAKMAPNALASQRDPKMAGTWKADDDAKATREFSLDGTVTDRYEGDASATDTGTWEVVDPTKEVIGVPAESVAGMTVIRLNFEKTGPLFFSVLSVSDTKLELSYLGRGNTLSYTKVR